MKKCDVKIGMAVMVAKPRPYFFRATVIAATGDPVMFQVLTKYPEGHKVEVFNCSKLKAVASVASVSE